MLSVDDFYLFRIVEQYKLDSVPDFSTYFNIEFPLKKHINNWALLNGLTLCQIKISGSRAKGTAISLSSDFDLFISLSSKTTNTLRNVYDSLYDYFLIRGYQVRKQNVSIGIIFNGMKVDLVPGVRHSQYGNDHSLYRSKQKTWTQTNIDTHISHVKNSIRLHEIRALKIWRERHNLDFPSIYLELFVIRTLLWKKGGDWAYNFYYLLWSLSQDLVKVRIMDPANTNNCISDDLTLAEKKKIATQAYNDFFKPLTQIIW